MYRRLINNPNFYNLEEVKEESISAYLSELIDETVDYLTQIKCIENEEEEDEEEEYGDDEEGNYDYDDNDQDDDRE